MRDAQSAARAHRDRGKKAVNRADFAEAAKELEHAHRLWPTCEALNEAGVDFKSKQSAYEVHMTTARDALAKRDFAKAREACKKARERCPESQEAAKLSNRIVDDEDADNVRRREDVERRRERRDNIKQSVLRLIKLLVILAPLVGMAIAFIHNWAWILNTARPWVLGHRGSLAVGWGLLLCVTGSIHRVRYTNFYRHIFSGIFGRRSDRARAALAMVWMILALLTGAPAFGAYRYCDRLFAVTEQERIALGIACGLALLTLAFIHSIVSRCKWRPA
jgi:hypothetical protein